MRPRGQYVVATLLDLRDDAALAAFERRAAGVDASVTVVSLLAGSLTFPPGALQAGIAFAAAATPAASSGPPLSSGLPLPSSPTQPRASVVARPVLWPAHVPTGARHGFSPGDRAAFDASLQAVADDVAGELHDDHRVLVVGTEELMYLPVRLAHLLGQLPGEVLVQSTTRSPVAAHDEDGYAVRRTLRFTAPDDPGRESLLHNVAPLDWRPSPVPPYTDVVVVADAGPRACRPLLDQLAPWASRTVHLVQVPARQQAGGPA